MLDFHPEALARHVRAVPGLGHHAVQSRALELLEPFVRLFRVARVRREEDRLLDALEHLLEPLPPLAEGLLAKVGGAFGEEVESEEPRRRSLAEHAHPRLSL